MQKDGIVEKYTFKSTHLLEGLGKADTEILKASLVRKEIKKNKLIFQEGAYPKGLYFLRKGKVKIYQTTREGKERIIYFYTRGDWFGYRPILCDEVHPVTAKAMEDSVLSYIPASTFLKVLSQSTTLSNKLLKNLSHEFSVWVNKTTRFSQMPVRDRVILSLFILDAQFNKSLKSRGRHEVSILREDLANYLDSTKETVVRILTQLKEENVLDTKGRKIIIKNPNELFRLVEEYG